MDTELDTLIIGSGFGGCMAAHALLDAGERVGVLERGGWVQRGPHNWGDEGGFVLTPHYSTETPYDVRQGRRWEEVGQCNCVGGPSVFYGGSSFRFRERDFRRNPEITDGSAAAWPLGYEALRPFYAEAERLLGVSGAAGEDPTEPPREGDYPQPPPEWAPITRRLADAARERGLHPFPIPLALNFAGEGVRCVQCTTCDAFACAIGAKNDLASRVMPDLLARGLELSVNTVAVRLVHDGRRVTGVECVDRASGERRVLRAGRYVLAAGALASPHLLLASGLERLNPGGRVVGRYLMRHCNAMVYGLFLRPPNPEGLHHKQLAIHDFYFGDDSGRAPAGKLGNLQQVMTPPLGMIRAMLPAPLRLPASLLVPRMTGLLAIAEDQPRAENRVEIDAARPDRFGLPRLRVRHRYTRRDLRARRALVRRAKQVLRGAGARACVTWKVTTFSHAVGTVRMGDDPATSALDPACRFRGVDNLYVVDGSVMPTSAGVNPSLTIAALALRAARMMNGES